MREILYCVIKFTHWFLLSAGVVWCGAEAGMCIPHTLKHQRRKVALRRKRDSFSSGNLIYGFAGVASKYSTVQSSRACFSWKICWQTTRCLWLLRQFYNNQHITSWRWLIPALNKHRLNCADFVNVFQYGCSFLFKKQNKTDQKLNFSLSLEKILH